MALYDINCITNFLSLSYLDIRDINNYTSTSNKNHNIFNKSECIMIILDIINRKSYIDNSDMFYRIGGIKYIISSINNNFRNKNILELSFRSLCNIIFKNDVNKVIVYSYGINDILLKAIKSDDNNLVCHILKLFSNMVIRSNEVLYDIMYNDRILCIVEKIMKSENLECFHNGLRFIQNISYDKYNPFKKKVRIFFSKIIIDNKNIIDLLFNLFQKFYSDKNIIISNFIRSLLNLISNKKILNMLKKDIYINKLNSLYKVTNDSVIQKKIKRCLYVLNKQ